MDSVLEMLEMINASLAAEHCAPLNQDRKDEIGGNSEPKERKKRKTLISLEMEKERYSEIDPEHRSLDTLVQHVESVLILFPLPCIP